MKIFSRLALTINSFIFLFSFISCTMMNRPNSKSSVSVFFLMLKSRKSEVVMIPINDPSIQFKDGSTLKINADGNVSVDEIQFFEVTITSESGITITQTVSANEEKAFFPDVETGMWFMDFKAYAKMNSKKILIAKNRESKKILVKENEESNVEIDGYAMKYVSVNTKIENISISAENKERRIELDGYDLPISELLDFKFDGNIIKISSDGLITPLKSGTETVRIARLQDGKYPENCEFNVTVVPVISVEILLKENSSSHDVKSSLSHEIKAETSVELEERLKNFPIESILEGKEADSWYYEDPKYTELRLSDEGTLDLSGILPHDSDANGGELLHSIEIYGILKYGLQQ